jgi:hypothetical protein
LGIFKTGSLKLFAQAGFEQPSSWSLPPEYLGLSEPPMLGFATHLSLNFNTIYAYTVGSFFLESGLLIYEYITS